MVIDTINNEIQSSPIRVYCDDTRFDGAWGIGGGDIKDIACTLKALPGVKDKIQFSQNIINEHGEFKIFSIFIVSFFGDHGQVGYEFLYSALEKSRVMVQTDDHWYPVTEMWGEQVQIFSRSVTLTCFIYDAHYHGGLCECINYEILNPKWEKYWDLFGLISEVEFVTVK
jgi:hypothetical protein